MATNASSSPVAAGQEERQATPLTVPEGALAGVVLVAVVVGVGLRFVLTQTPMWLDEAQTAAIAGLPLGDIPAALRQDGHPPLYYVLLHGWMQLFGHGDAAVRSLSAVLGVLALAPLTAAARRVGGVPTALAAAALAATSPFLVRYATEARMYSLVLLLAFLWWLALQRALEQPRAGRLAGVGVLAGALLLTHYWTAFLLVAGAIPLVVRLVRRDGSAPDVRRVLAAQAAGGLLFLPWVPSLLEQLSRTGTPWATAPNPVWAVVKALADFAGGAHRGAGLALHSLLVVLVLLGLFGRALDRRRIELDLSVVRPARPVAILLGLTIAVALGAVWVTDTAFATRYLAIVVGLVVVLAARGVAQLDVSIRTGVLAAAAILGVLGSWHAVTTDRSQGQQVARAVAQRAGPDALVVACPDQLGPAVARYLPDDVEAVGYPLLTPAGRVDWTDYALRNDDAEPRQLANRIATVADGAEVWLVWQSGYRTFDRQCEQLRQALGRRLGEPVEVISPRADVFEPMRLTRFRG